MKKILLFCFLAVANMAAAQCLSGTYTIGGASPDYTTFNAAVSDLATRGVCGPVTFNVRNGVYNEFVTIPSISGASVANTITFQSESGDSSTVVLENNLMVDFTVRFDGAACITLQNMTLGNASTTANYSSVIVFINRNSHIQIKGNSMRTTTTATHPVITTNAGRNNFISIDHNRIVNGSSAIYFFNDDSISVGTSFYCKEMLINNNVLVNQWNKGIYIAREIAPVITFNTITTPATSGSGASGIATQFISGPMQVSRNTVNGFYYGIQHSLSRGTPSSRMVIYNNMLYASIGINFDAATYTDVFFNSINATNTGLEAGNSNHIRNMDNSYAVDFTGVFNGMPLFMDSLNVLEISDYNNYYSSYPYTASVYVPAYISATLPDWQAFSGLDAHSVSAAPAYTSATDLHLNMDTVLAHKGIAIAGITGDIDGDVRNATAPCIGADESFDVNTGIAAPVKDDNFSIYPNPYSDHTDINYMLNEKSAVQIEVYNSVGQKIQTLVNANQPAGNYKSNFSAKALDMDAGIYFVRITINGNTTMKRIVEMK